MKTKPVSAGQQFKAMGRSSLLPVLSGTYTTNENEGDITHNSLIQHLNYPSESGIIHLRQPVVNLEASTRYKQGFAKASLSDAEFSLRNQDVIVCLASAYMEARYAEDQLALTFAAVRALLAINRLIKGMR